MSQLEDDLLDIPTFLKRDQKPVATIEPKTVKQPWIMPKIISKPKRHRLPADLKAALVKLGWTAHYRAGMTVERALVLIRRQAPPARKRRSNV